jgi:hypothetical protein
VTGAHPASISFSLRRTGAGQAPTGVRTKTGMILVVFFWYSA